MKIQMNLTILRVILDSGSWSDVCLERVESKCHDRLIGVKGSRDRALRTAIATSHGADDINLVRIRSLTTEIHEVNGCC